MRGGLIARVALLTGLWGCPQSVETLPDAAPTADAGVLPAADGGVADAGVPDGGGPAPDAGGPACTPECGARQCGLDPVCQVSCGECSAGTMCSTEALCLPSCAPGSYACSPDGFGYQACGPNDVLGVWDLGPRVACAGGAACEDGRSQPCDRSACVPADVMVLWDRSSRTALNSLWTRARESLRTVVEGHDEAGRFGFREFPDGACAAGPIGSLTEGASAGLDAALTAPGNEASTPLAAALEGLETAFRAGEDGQAVLLVTAGDETCTTPEATVRAAAELHRLGVRTYVVALTPQANRTLLDAVAEAGGTGAARYAEAPEDLPAALTDVLADLGACENRRTTVATGYYHACRLSPDGSIDCWGRDYDGRLSPPPASYVALAAGTDNACAVTDTAELRCWGRNHRGQSTPPAGAFSQVAGGDSHFCGLRLDGTVACWGYDDAGQATPPAGRFTQVALGAFHSCGLRPDGTVECWGNRPTPSGTFRQLDGGGFGTCGVRTDGTLACTGSLSAVPPGTFVQVSSGGDHGCAVRTDDTVACWGLDHWSQSQPPEGRFTSVSVNNEYSCGVRLDDTLVCWGYGGDGQAMPPP